MPKKYIDDIRKRECGFTLLEIAIALAVAGIMLAAVLSVYERLAFDRQRTETRERMHEIRKAMAQYYYQNNFYPCPTAAINPDEPYKYDGDCHVSDALTRKELVKRGVFFTKNGEIVEGAVPYKLLNISRENASDGWGHLFSYAISLNATEPGVRSATGQISVSGANGTSLITPEGSALWIVLSHGIDGSGAYNGYSDLMVSACDEHHLDGLNCGHSGKFIVAPISLGNNKSYFDDTAYYQVWTEDPEDAGQSHCMVNPGGNINQLLFIQEGAIVRECGNQPGSTANNQRCPLFLCRSGHLIPYAVDLSDSAGNPIPN